MTKSRSCVHRVSQLSWLRCAIQLTLVQSSVCNIPTRHMRRGSLCRAHADEGNIKGAAEARDVLETTTTEDF